MRTEHLWTLVTISMIKLTLKGNMPPEFRLRFLGYIEKWTDSVLTSEIIARVDPMDENGLELYREAAKLGHGPRPPNMFTVLSQKFDVFASLNPSLQRAYDEACRPWSKSA